MPTCAAVIDGQKIALTWPEGMVRKAFSPTADQRTKYERYMKYEMMMAPSVPLGMAVDGSCRSFARLAPERMPVKHGKKSERHSEKPYSSLQCGPQFSARLAAA